MKKFQLLISISHPSPCQKLLQIDFPNFYTQTRNRTCDGIRTPIHARVRYSASPPTLEVEAPERL